MSLHVLCPHCGTEFEVGNGDAKNASIPTDGTYFLVPKSTVNDKNSTIGDILKNMGMCDHSSEPSNNDETFEKLKRELFIHGQDAIEEFLGYELSGLEEKDAIEKAMDNVYAQMPDDEFNKFVEEYASSDPATDEIEDMIRKTGDVKNHHLYRRWIMAQVLRAYKSDKPAWFDDRFITGTDYKYEWDTILNELNVLAHMEADKDPELVRRERFYNKEMVVACAKSYRKKLKSYLIKRFESSDRVRTITEEKFHYIKIPYYAYMEDGHPCILLKNKKEKDRYNQLMHSQHRLEAARTIQDFIDHVDAYVQNIETIANQNGSTYKDLYKAVNRFRHYCPMSVHLTKDSAWKNAFKGAGAYYTMQNMIRFHNCFLKDVDESNQSHLIGLVDKKTNEYGGKYHELFALEGDVYEQNKSQSLELLDKKTEEYKGEYYKLFAMFKDFLLYNRFDIQKTLASWD